MIQVSPTLLLDVLEGIRHTHNIGACFFACSGPDVPPVSMKTTHACWQGWRIRCLLIKHGAPITRPAEQSS